MVDLVTPFVKPTTLETKFEAVLCTPFTMDAAKSDPGSVGIDIDLPLAPGADTFVPTGEGLGVDGR